MTGLTAVDDKFFLRDKPHPFGRRYTRPHRFSARWATRMEMAAGIRQDSNESLALFGYETW